MRIVPRLAAGLALATVVIPVPSASALSSITKASLSSTGALSVEGKGAVAGSTVTVRSLESTATAVANSKGDFRVTASNFRASDCRVTVADSRNTLSATLSGCTVQTNTLAPGPRGPGYVGSDFTNNATLGSVIAMGPNAVGPLTVRITTGALPPGLSFQNDPTCSFTPAKCPYVTIVGTPTTVGTFNFTVDATDAAGSRANGAFSIVVNPAIDVRINQQQQPTITVGQFANVFFDGTGGVRPYVWSATQLPPGMTFTVDTNTLTRVTGTPTTAGTFRPVIRLTDARGVTATLTATIVIG